MKTVIEQETFLENEQKDMNDFIAYIEEDKYVRNIKYEFSEYEKCYIVTWERIIKE